MASRKIRQNNLGIYPSNSRVIKELKKYEPRGMNEHQLPVVWQSAYGDMVTDIEGKRYIDFTSGIFVTNVGHGLVERRFNNNSA